MSGTEDTVDTVVSSRRASDQTVRSPRRVVDSPPAEIAPRDDAGDDTLVSPRGARGHPDQADVAPTARRMPPVAPGRQAYLPDSATLRQPSPRRVAPVAPPHRPRSADPVPGTGFDSLDRDTLDHGAHRRAGRRLLWLLGACAAVAAVAAGLLWALSL